MDFMPGDRVRILEKRMGLPGFSYEETIITKADYGTVVRLWGDRGDRVLVRPDGEAESLVFHPGELRLVEDGGAMTAASL